MNFSMKKAARAVVNVFDGATGQLVGRKLVGPALIGGGLMMAGSVMAAPIDVSALGTAVDLSTINTTIGAVFTSIVTVTAFIWAGYKIIKLFRG